MTVKELIERLEEFPENAKVQMYTCPSGNYYNILTDIEDINLNNNDTVIIEGYE